MPPPYIMGAIAYRGASFWSVIWVFKKKEAPILSVDKFVL
jgi:hypothetical protein